MEAMKIQGRRAVSYARYSSEHQRIESIVEQQNQINRHIKGAGLFLVQEYVDEAKTGKNDCRTSFKRMVSDAERGLFDIIVILNFSRLFRNLYQHLTYKQKLAQYGVKIISVFENYDETTPEGTLFSNVQLSINQYYSDNLSRMTKNAQLSEARNAKFMGGRTLYGYKVDPETKRIVIEESEVENVRLIFQMFLDGHNAREVARHLAAEGITNRGKPFAPYFHDMLVNETYRGIYQYNRRIKFKGGVKNTNRHVRPAKEIVRIADGVPRIIDDETFERVNQIIRERRGKKDAAKYLLSGKLKCVCGYSMSGAHKKAGRSKTSYFSYRCHCRRSNIQPCGTKELKVAPIDDYVMAYLRKLLLVKEHGKLINFINKHIRAANGIRRPDPEIAGQLAELDAGIEKLVKALDGMSAAVCAAITEEIQQLNNRKCELEGVSNTGTFYTEIPLYNPHAHDKYVGYYRELLRKGTFEGNKETVRDLIKEVTVSSDTITLTIRLNYLLGNKLFRDLTYDVVEDRDTVMLGNPTIIIR